MKTAYGLFALAAMCCFLIAAEAKQAKKALDKSAPAYQPAFLLDTARDWCEGFVKEVTKTSITIEPIPFSSGGTGLRTYELSPRLASGDYPRDISWAFCWRSAATTSLAVRFRADNCSGCTQIRIE